MRFRPGVNTQFSHGNGTSRKCVKMTNLLQDTHSTHSSWHFVLCAINWYFWTYGAKMLKKVGESSHFFNFAPCVSPWYWLFDIQKKSGPLIIQRHNFSIDYRTNMEKFLSVLCFGPDPCLFWLLLGHWVSLCGFSSSWKYGRCTLQAHVRMFHTS